MTTNRARLGAALGLLLVAVLAFPSVSSAQRIVIVGGTVHPVDQPARVTNLAIRDGLIEAIGDDVTPGPDDEVIDAAGGVVTPGLVDFGAYVGAVEVWAVDSTRDADPGGDPVRSAFRISDTINPQSVLVNETRRGGVTSVVTHPRGGLISGQSAWIDLAGERADQMVVVSPVTMDLHLDASAAGATGGSRGGTMLRYRELFADTRAYLDDARSYDAGQMRELSASRLDLESLGPMLSGELPAYVLASRRDDLVSAMHLADEYGLQLILSRGCEAWAVADELAERGIPVVVDPILNLPSSFEAIGTRADNAAILDAAGVSVILTTDEAHNVRLLRQYAGNAVRAGMPWESALEAITLRPAQAAGLGDRYGSLTPGKVANVVVWSGDPFEFSTRVENVIIQGRSVSLDSRQNALFRRYRHLEPGRNQLETP